MLASKVVPTSSGEFTIAPLTLSQVESMFPGDKGPTRMELVLVSLENAGKPTNAEDLKNQVSPRSMRELVAAIMDLTGLEFEPVGEVTAAETLTPTSTAA